MAHLVVPKTNQIWKYFFHYMKKMYPVHKRTESEHKIALYYFFTFHRLVLWLQLFESFIFKYISFSTDPAENRLIIWDLQSVYGSLMIHLGELFTGVVWWSEPVHLDESIPTHIIQSFTRGRFKYFIEAFTILPSKVKKRSGFGTIWKWTDFTHKIDP